MRILTRRGHVVGEQVQILLHLLVKVWPRGARAHHRPQFVPHELGGGTTAAAAAATWRAAWSVTSACIET